jgi:RND family efflux transporter MFP subunit
MTDVANGEIHGERPPKSAGKSLFVVFFLVVAILLVAGTILVLMRRGEYQTLAKNTETLAIPTVAVIHPIPEPGDENLVLPGTMQAYVESPIYARTNGYLKKWYHDIGSRVNKGDLLADIDTPEVDQELSQSRADLNTSKANESLSQITATRYTELLKTDGVSKQEVDNANGDLEAKRAIVQSGMANVRRLEELESFKHIYAPFGGVITRRNVDIGTLVNAGNGGSAAQLFFLAQTDPIRVFLNVPEAYVSSIRPGLGAYLELTQYPGQRFQGKVVRTSESIDIATRSLLTEVDVPNRSGVLLPGGFAQVHLEVQAVGQPLQVPVNALLFRAEGLRAVVITDGHTKLQRIAIGRDYGNTLEVVDGLKPNDWIVLNPPDSLEDNQKVNVKQVANPVAQPATGSAPQTAPGASAPAPSSKPQEKKP